MAIFNSYVSLPEGMTSYFRQSLLFTPCIFPCASGHNGRLHLRWIHGVEPDDLAAPLAGSHLDDEKIPRNHALGGDLHLRVGGLEHEFYDFPYIGNVIIPTDEVHHFSEG